MHPLDDIYMWGNPFISRILTLSLKSDPTPDYKPRLYIPSDVYILCADFLCSKCSKNAKLLFTEIWKVMLRLINVFFLKLEICPETKLSSHSAAYNRVRLKNGILR